MVLAWSWCGVGVGRHGAGTGWHGLGRALGTPSCLSQLCHQTPLPHSCPRARMAPWAPRAASSAFRESGVGAPTHPRGLWGQRPVGRSQDGRGSQVWGPALLWAPSPSGSPLSCLEGGGGRVPRARTPPSSSAPPCTYPEAVSQWGPAQPISSREREALIKRIWGEANSSETPPSPRPPAPHHCCSVPLGAGLCGARRPPCPPVIACSCGAVGGLSRGVAGGPGGGMG